MTQLGSPYPGARLQEGTSHDPRLWLFVGLGVMLALVGVGVLFVALHTGGFPYRYGFWPFGFFWFPWGLFFLFFVFFWWIPRWGWGLGHYGRRYWRHGFDPAYSIARERFARGEISKEQYDQILRDLG